MAVKIRLKRMGKIRAPYYRVIVIDGRKKRDGRAIEEIGKYHPTEEPSLIEIDSERARHWISVGAQPTEQVLALLKITGDWQAAKGLPGAEGTLRKKESNADAAAEERAQAIQAAQDEAEKRKAKASEAAAAAKENEAPAEAAEDGAGAEATDSESDAG